MAAIQLHFAETGPPANLSSSGTGGAASGSGDSSLLAVPGASVAGGKPRGSVLSTMNSVSERDRDAYSDSEMYDDDDDGDEGETDADDTEYTDTDYEVCEDPKEQDEDDLVRDQENQTGSAVAPAVHVPQSQSQSDDQGGDDAAKSRGLRDR